MTNDERKFNDIKGRKYCSLKEYCFWRGVKYRAVAEAIQNGRLDGAWTKVGKGYQIFRELADKLWVENANNDRPVKLRDGESEDKAGDTGNSIDGKYGQVEGINADAPRSNYNKARAVEKTFQAKLAQIEYNEKIGKLIERDQVEKEFGEVAQRIKNSLMNIPGRIMDKIAAENDPFKCELILRNEINETLELLNHELRS